MILGELMASDKKSVDPRKFPDDEFELFSIPAYEEGKPELVLGSEIGSSKQILQPNDVLISRIVPHIRRAWVVSESNGPIQIGSSEWIIFRASEYHSQYLRHYLLSDQFNAQFMSTVAGVGGSLLRARPAAVAKLDITLPEFDEQIRIAAILDKADEIKQYYGETDQIRQQIVSSLFIDFFGDPVTNNKGWPVKQIQEIAGVQGGLQVSRKRHDLPLEFPYLRVANVYRDKLNLSEIKTMKVRKSEFERVKLQKNDVLVVEGHGNKNEIGRSAVWDGSIESCIHQNHLIRIRPNQDSIHPIFLSFYINSQGGRTQMFKSSNTTSGLNTISTRIVKEMSCYLPPIELQEKFATNYNTILNSTEHDENSVDELLKSTLQELMA